MKSVSFVIPLYNREKRLKEIFETLSLAKGKFPRGKKLEEVIFIDNGSRDNTFAEVSRLCQIYPKLNVSIVTYKKKLGRNAAIEEGIKVSKSDINIALSQNLSDLAKKLRGLKPKSPKKRKPPLVSVIMPVFNAEKYVGAAIESIMNQTYKRFELIIIDDMSTDTSPDIIKSYKRRFRTKIKVIHTGKNLNGGGDMCANLGLEEARGKYIARMDADDIALPTRLEKEVDFLEKNKRVFLVGSSAYVIDSRGKVVGEKQEPCKPYDIYRAYATFHPIIHPTALFRRIIQGKPFSYQIAHSANNDYYTFFKLLCRGYIFVNLEEKLLYYRIHDKNDTFVHIKQKFVNTIKIRLAMVSGHNYKPTIKDIAINIVQALTLLILPERLIKNLYLVTKGIVKPKAINIPVFGRFPAPSV